MNPEDFRRWRAELLAATRPVATTGPRMDLTPADADWSEAMAEKFPR